MAAPCVSGRSCPLLLRTGWSALQGRGRRQGGGQHGAAASGHRRPVVGPKFQPVLASSWLPPLPTGTVLAPRRCLSAESRTACGRWPVQQREAAPRARAASGGRSRRGRRRRRDCTPGTKPDGLWSAGLRLAVSSALWRSASAQGGHTGAAFPLCRQAACSVAHQRLVTARVTAAATLLVVWRQRPLVPE